MTLGKSILQPPLTEKLGKGNSQVPTPSCFSPELSEFVSRVL